MSKKIYLFVFIVIIFGGFSATAHAQSITQFSAFPTSVKSGDPSTITWNSTQLTDGCTSWGTSYYGWNAGGGGLEFGSQTINPAITRPYSIRCSEDITTRTAGPLTITVTPNPPAALQFDTTAVSITAGAPVTMTWSTRYATSCTGTGTGFTSPGTSGPLDVYPTVTTTYSLQCTGPGGVSGSYNKAVTVTPSASVSASPTTIVSGNSSLITWSSVGATSCTGSNFNTGGATSGSTAVSPTSNTSYSMSCISADGHTGFSNVEQIVVTAPPAINASCSVTPTSASTGQNVTWNASASGGTPPYTYEWTGSGNLVGSGLSQIISYTSAGLKYASIKVTDSATNLTPWTQVHTANRRCSGTPTGVSYWQAVEDGGTQAESEATVHEQASSSFWNPSWGTPPPGAFYTNPENYCVEEDVRIYGCTSICTFGQNVKLYSGSGTRAVNGGDPLNHVYATETVQPSVPVPTPNTITMACTNNVNVSAVLPTATLSAMPVSITMGSSTALTWSSTDATSCTGTNFATGGSTSGSIGDTPAATTPYTLVCSGPGGTATSSVTVSVTAPPSSPDLATSGFSPTSATVGTPLTFTANISNIGNAVTPAFTSVFYICPEGDAICQAQALGKAPSLWTRVLAYFRPIAQAASVIKLTTNSTTLAASAGGVQTANYTFPGPAGNYAIKFCANNDGSGTHYFTEPNYVDNCGSWTTVVVAPALITLTCTVNDTHPGYGFPAIYTASPGSAAPYTWDDALGGSYGTTNSAVRSFPDTGGTFAMSVQGVNTTLASCPLVTYDSACAVTSSASIVAFPPRVKKGSTTGISWSIDRAPGSSCVVSGPGISYTSPTIPSCTGPVPLDETTGSTTPAITNKVVYNVVCNGVEVASTTVNLIPTFNEF